MDLICLPGSMFVQGHNVVPQFAVWLRWAIQSGGSLSEANAFDPQGNLAGHFGKVQGKRKTLEHVIWKP